MVNRASLFFFAVLCLPQGKSPRNTKDQCCAHWPVSFHNYRNAAGVHRVYAALFGAGNAKQRSGDIKSALATIALEDIVEAQKKHYTDWTRAINIAILSLMTG